MFGSLGRVRGLARRSMECNIPTPEDVAAITRKMFEMDKGGVIQAIREVLLRVLGRPQEADLIERLEKLEDMALADRR